MTGAFLDHNGSFSRFLELGIIEISRLRDFDASGNKMLKSNVISQLRSCYMCVCVRMWFFPSNMAILGRVLEHLGNVFTIWPSYDWDFEISRFRLPGGIKMLKSTGFRTITAMLHMRALVVLPFQKGHSRPRRRAF